MISLGHHKAFNFARVRWGLCACAVGGAVVLCSPAQAWAQPKSRVVTISEVTIVGRVQKPIASVDVSRIPIKLTVHERQRKFLPRVERALYRAPF